MGASTGASITVLSPPGDWPAGAYVLELTADGAASSCTLEVPSSPSATSPVSASCTSPGASFSFQEATHCMMIDAGAGVSGGECRSVPGQSSLLLALVGTPHQLSLALARDGAQLGTDSLMLSYQMFYPNGPSCGGACQQASAQWTVAAAAVEAGAAPEAEAPDASCPSNVPTGCSCPTSDNGDMCVCACFSMPECPASFQADLPPSCAFAGSCMNCLGSASGIICACTDAGVFQGSDGGGAYWQCIPTEQACTGGTFHG